ncbi:MAG: lactate utilization protein [Clostridia bacterium]|nr:lactate utilization protein [Clostridia bacterium]
MKIENVLNALRQNKMDAYYVDTKEEARALALSLIPEGAVCASGGSVTLTETGILDAVKSGNYTYIDRYAPDLTEEERADAVARAHHADVYLMSSNAITENGELYNVDGNSNRVSALVLGPKSVIVVAGVNKLVPTLDDAILRVKTVAAPKNTVRLACATPCAKTGHCISLDTGHGTDMTKGCASPARICCNFVVSAQQRHQSRIKVILVGEALGY